MSVQPYSRSTAISELRRRTHLYLRGGYSLRDAASYVTSHAMAAYGPRIANSLLEQGRVFARWAGEQAYGAAKRGYRAWSQGRGRGRSPGPGFKKRLIRKVARRIVSKKSRETGYGTGTVKYRAVRFRSGRRRYNRTW